MTNNGKLMNIVSFPDGDKIEPASCNVTFEQFQAIISYVKKQEPSEEIQRHFLRQMGRNS